MEGAIYSLVQQVVKTRVTGLGRSGGRQTQVGNRPRGQSAGRPAGSGGWPAWGPAGRPAVSWGYPAWGPAGRPTVSGGCPAWAGWEAGCLWRVSGLEAGLGRLGGRPA